MKRKLIGIGVVAMVLALLLTMAPACGNGDGDEGEVLTLKMGFIGALSGAAAAWGTDHLEGTEWASDVINEGGGIQVGDDTYMIEIVPCDDKGGGNEGATCAYQLADQGIHYVVGPQLAPSVGAILPIFEANQMFSTELSSSNDPSPDLRYHIAAATYIVAWVDSWLAWFTENYPEAESIGILGASWNKAPGTIGGEGEVQAPTYGLEVVGHHAWEPGTTDLYPQLTPLVAANPDVIGIGCSAVNATALATKQLRELGYEGIIWHWCGGTFEAMLDIAGVEAMEGVITNEIDWESPAWPTSTKNIVQDWDRRNPGEPLTLLHELGYLSVMLYAEAMEEAGSIDHEAVMAVFDDPNWTYDRFGLQATLGGNDTFGIRRQVPIVLTHSVVHDGKLETKSTHLIEVP